MGSLTTCLRKVGDAPRAADKDAIVARARELRAGGMATDAASRQAATELLQDVRADIKALSEPRAPKDSTHPKTVMGSELLAAVSRRLGGLDPAWLAEFSTRFETGRKDKQGRPVIQWRNPMVPGVGLLFRRGGTQDLQAIAEVAEAEGYLEPGAVERDAKDAGERAKDMIRAALERKVVERLDNQIDEAQARMDAEREAYYAELDAESAREAEAERAAIMAEAKMSRAEMASLSDDDPGIDFAPLERQNTPDEVAAGMRAMGFTEQEIADELASRQPATAPAQAGPAETGQARPESAQAPLGAGEDAPRAEGSGQGLTLSAQTPEDLRAKAERESAAAKADAAEQKRLADKAKADAKRNEFTLTGSDRPADVAAAAGQGGLFDGPSEPAAAPPTKPAGANNTVFTQSDAEKARALLRKKLGQFNSGIDPEMLQAGITLAGYHIEAGARTFAKFVRAMVDDLGEAVRPYLKSWYAAVSFDPRAAAFTGDMTPVAEVVTIDVDAITTESSDVPSTDAGMERDRADGAGAPRAVGDAVPADAGGTAAGPAAARIQPGEGGRGPADDPGLLAGGAVPAGVGGDQRVPGADRAGLPEEFPAGSERPGRGDDARDGGIPPQHVTAGDVAKDAGAGLPNESRLAAQRAAERIPVVPGDAENILATLPYLLSGQQEDVGKAEARFAQPDGYGMLFTNGTGTGKTFTALGMVKRFARQGKTNTLIVVPDDKIMADWVASAKALDLTVTPLKSTKDAGSGITITTYANLGDNAAVAGRDWDLVVPDEAHSLSQGKDGSPTKALDVLRAITHHPRGAYTRYSLLNAADIERLSDLTARITGNVKIMNNPDTMDEMLVSLRAENVKLEAQQSALVNKLDAARKAVEQDVKARQGARRTRVLMLSATPFAYEKSVDLAEGYLFDYTDGYPYEKTGSRPYNQPDPHDYFFMTHFGYRMRVNKLTEPDDPKLDRGLLQRQFNGWLKKQGVLSQRSLDVAADYDRRFVLVDSAVGNRIDEALAWVSERSRKEAESNRERKRGTEDGGFASLEGALRDQLYGSDGYLVRRYLLEAIKAKEIIPHVREHMAMGRKVVVFHDFNKGGSRNPFALTEVPQEIIDAGIGLEGASGDAARKAQQYNDALAEFKREYPDLTGGELLRDLISPIERFRREFPDVLLVNGLEKKRDLLARYRLFNDDAAGPQVMLVQSEKNKGWSGHDTTGKHQRVLFNLGLPTKPTMAIQQEGRIYRTGQVSDALFRYLNTGTNWERWAFAQTIAQRASVADNLGSGEAARALRDAFISGFEESGDFRAGHEGEGKGGKERDRIVDTATSDFDRAKSFYRGTQKKNSRTKAEEGADYFATPEPLGLKMVQWLDLRGGESGLEPSGGHGAIARWLPDNVDRTAIEPSMTLRSRMALVFEGKIVPTSFEDFHIVNKFDGVGMNPPFGTAGRLAIEHLAKATQHLRDGGRVAAIIPTGPAADAKFDKWLYALDDKGKPLHPDLHLVADIRLPAVTFERAGTAVSTRVVIIDKGKDAPQAIHRDLSDITSIEELFNRIEDMEVPKRLKAEAAAPDPAARPQPAADARAQAQADKAAAQEDGEQIAQRLGLQVIEHVTKGGAGKTLRGVLRPDLKPAQAQEVDAYTFKKDGAQFIRLEHMAEMVRKYPPPGTVAAEERAVYAVNEPTGTDVPLDLFPESLQGLQALPAEPRAGGRGRPGSAAAGDVQPAAAVPAKPNTFAEREDPQFPGLYHYSTQLVQVGQRELPVAKVENWQQAASALAAMGRYAVEHFDVLITDANGKPLAVVGAFKGAQAQAPVYPSTVLAEALRIKGAAKAWGVHNHPSGDASLSRADEHLSNTLAQAFGPSTVDWMGIAAIGGDKFSAFDGVRPYYDSLITGPTKATVPVVERTITPGNKDMPKLENPPTARKVAGTIAAGRSGVLFTDVQHRVTAFVPLESAHAKELRKDGRFDRLINAASNAGAGAAVIVNQAEVYDARTLENIASALRLADIRVLDAVDPVRGTSLAQQGLEPRGNVPVLSQSPAMKRGTGPGADIATLKPHIDAIAAKLQGLRAPVQVVSTVFDLPGDIVAALRSMNAMGTTRGLRMPDGRVFLVADKLRDQAEAEFVLFHELFGHEGIRALLDEAAYARELTKLKLANPALASEANQWFASYGADQIAARVERGMSEPEARKVVRLLAIEEALSDRAGKNEPLKGWQAFMAAIQKALRAVGAEGLANWLESRTQAETMALLNAARKAITEGVAHVTRETAASAPVLNRRADTMAPAVAVLRDETGTPTEFVGPRVVLAYPQETERFEVIPEPGQKILSYAIMPAEGFDSLGFVELLVENGRPVSLLDIEVQPYKRQAGTGAAVIETLLAADPKAELHISNIVESARGFWERMGVPQQNRAHGEAYDGILDWNTFAQAQDQRAAQSLGRRSAARVAEPDRDGQSPDRRGPGDAQGDGGGQADFPALSRVPPRDPVTEAALRKAGISGRQSLSDKVRAAYGRAIDAIRSHDAIADEFTQGALDQFYGIKKAVTKTVGGLGVEQDPYVTARLANGGTSSVMRGLLLHGQAKWAGNGQHLEKIDGTKGLLDILRPLGDDLNDWFGWMIGNRAERLAREGRENNLSADEIKALQALATPERAPVFKKAAVEYAAFKRSVLNVAQDAGLIDGEARKAWDHADYIPFYREIDERSTFSPTGRKGLAGQSSGIRQLKGGESSLNDPMENLLMNFSRLIDASLKNNAIRKTIDTLGETDLVKKVGYDMRTSIVPKQQVKKILAEAGTPQGIIAVLPDAVFEGMAKMWAIQAPTDPNVVRVMRGGRPEFYSVSDPLLLRALTSFVPFDFPGLAIMRAAKRVLTATVTATPEFMARNFIRDSMASQAITKSPFNPVESLKGIKRSYAEQGGYESMLFAGASFQSGNVNSGNPESTAVHMRRALRERGMDASSVESFMGSIIDYTAAGWEKYRQVGEAIENANREAVYEGAKKAGKSPTEAAYEAKDLMDFSLRGSWAGYQLLADVLPFFNARVQGLYRVGRSDPKRLAVVGGVMLAATMALAMANAGEPWYEELEDWDKDGYWHFKVKGKHFRIPKPFELGVIFATVPERIGRGVMGLDSPKRTISRVWANVRDQLAFDPVPQLFRPALDAWANKDSFRDRPIEGMGDEGKPVHARYNERTSDTMRILADTAAPVTDAAGLSPKKLEFLVNGYFGTAGMYALALSDAAVRSIEGGPVRPQMRVDDLPVVRAFYREDPARSTVFASDVYKMHSEIEQIVREYRSLKGPNASPADEAKAEKLKADNKAKFDARNDLTIATDKMRTINKKMTGVYSDTKMTAAEKRVAIDQLQLEKNNAARDAATAKVVKDAF
jgi:hypothetical protein